MNDERPHVLVIDDDNRLRDLLGKFLGEHGFLVVTASDAADARDKMTLFAFDIIVLDLMMPGENGLDFAEDLRHARKYQKIAARGLQDHHIAVIQQRPAIADRGRPRRRDQCGGRGRDHR